MSDQNKIQQFRSKLVECISSHTFLKLSLSSYKGDDSDLKNVYVRSIEIKKSEMLSFTYRYKTRDIVKNLTIEEGIALIVHFISREFRICTLLSTNYEGVLERNKKGIILYREKQTTSTDTPNLQHDRVKKRIITTVGKNYLKQLRITNEQGNVFDNAQDKYRQINQYIEILSSLINELPKGSVKTVVDMGAGKGYLTFALYDYLNQVLNQDVAVTGVEYRLDLVNLCNDIAKTSGFTHLNFVQGSIDDYQIDSLDLLIGLHACDTATDDAIYKGIQAKAKLIVVAPCCHKQIRRSMEKFKVENDISFITQYGIFLERQAEMVTDAIRALILEYYGYKTKVFEFISDIHTPKNVMIVGIKGEATEKRQLEILHQLHDIKSFFGIDYHHLEKLAKLNTPEPRRNRLN